MMTALGYYSTLHLNHLQHHSVLAVVVVVTTTRWREMVKISVSTWNLIACSKHLED
jgi:hypothetical protein